jgi:hypothetical protein
MHIVCIAGSEDPNKKSKTNKVAVVKTLFKISAKNIITLICSEFSIFHSDEGFEGKGPNKGYTTLYT